MDAFIDKFVGEGEAIEQKLAERPAAFDSAEANGISKTRRLAISIEIRSLMVGPSSALRELRPKQTTL